MKINELQDAWVAAGQNLSKLQAKQSQMAVDLVANPDKFTDEEIKSVNSSVNKAEDILNTAKQALDSAKEDSNFKLADPELSDKEKKNKVIAKARKAINNFVHKNKFSNDATGGATSTVMAPTIPEEIIYDPSAEVNSVVDLSTLVDKKVVTTSKGTYPILKRADDTFPSVAELAENPALANPDFEEVNWSVETHRGAIAISQESIDDSSVDVSDLVGQNIGEKRVNTYNAAISAVLKGFTSKSATFGTDTSVDDIKHILNVDLDPAYNPIIVASQSFFNALDTLKDKNGQYVFHQDITSASRGTLLGVPVYKVGDKLLGEKGDLKAFVGDIKRAVLFADRKDVSLSWEYNPIYGQYIAGVLRYGVSAADPNAGFFVTASIAASTTGTSSQG